MKSIYVLGPVGAGKNSFLEKVASNNNVTTLDTGRLFRFISYELYEELKNDIDINKICLFDENEIEKLKDRIFHLSNFISIKLDNLNIKDNDLYLNNDLINIDKLYSKEVIAFLPIIAKIKMIREKIMNYIYAYLDNTDKNVIMAGHNIKEIDTTKFTVVFLDVSPEVASYRLYERNTSSYVDIKDAYDEVNIRNSTDRINETRNILPYLYNYIYIDTNHKSIDQIYDEFLLKLNMLENNNTHFIEKQSESIPRADFDWLFNPILLHIQKFLNEIVEKISNSYPYINKNDLIYQTLILISAYDINEIYCYYDKDYLDSISNNLNNRNKEMFDEFDNLVEKNIININYELVLNVMNSALNYLLNLYSNDNVKDIMTKYNLIVEKDILTSNGQLMNQDKTFKNTFEIRVIDSGMSKFISKYCHYLHTPRDDEFVAYGVFINNREYPDAYVSFSKQDRTYKKQLLYNIGIEPQNSIEMTRAWCSNNAPINMMSYLFQYAIDDISMNWKKLSEQNLVDKNLQSITTTINPNLGFRASSFIGSNFVPIAMRPAKFTYVDNNGRIEYETRRKIESSTGQEQYFENKISVLPLNELILCLDKRKNEKIKNNNILLIDKGEYETVLKEKELVKKKEI